jgi:hypothetical protein
MSAPACHQERTAMPNTPYLSGQQFDPETKRILGLAFELTCAALRIGECDDGVSQLSVAETTHRLSSLSDDVLQHAARFSAARQPRVLRPRFGAMHP